MKTQQPASNVTRFPAPGLPPHSSPKRDVEARLIIMIELAKFYYSLEEIAALFEDELTRLMSRPSAKVYVLRG